MKFTFQLLSNCRSLCSRPIQNWPYTSYRIVSYFLRTSVQWADC